MKRWRRWQLDLIPCQNRTKSIFKCEQRKAKPRHSANCSTFPAPINKMRHENKSFRLETCLQPPTFPPQLLLISARFRLTRTLHNPHKYGRDNAVGHISPKTVGDSFNDVTLEWEYNANCFCKYQKALSKGLRSYCRQKKSTKLNRKTTLKETKIVESFAYRNKKIDIYLLMWGTTPNDVNGSIGAKLPASPNRTSKLECA